MIRWEFDTVLTDAPGVVRTSWRWTRIGDDAIIGRAARLFDSLDACVADARAYGYTGDGEVIPSAIVRQ